MNKNFNCFLKIKKNNINKSKDENENFFKLLQVENGESEETKVID